MIALLAMLVVSVLFLAYSNGANDSFKGVATLFGSGTCSYRMALVWGTLTTLAGSMLALYLAHGLVQTFKGKGLVPDAITAQPAFLLAVSLGAALTVIIATRVGMPISTTHAVTGGLLGAGLVAAPFDVRLAALGGSFLLPLLLSPVISMALMVLVYPVFRLTRQRSGVTSATCVCIGTAYEEVMAMPSGAMALARTGVVIEVGTTTQCIERYQGRVMGLDAGRLVDGQHFMSGGAVGFARGLNDTPKIVALLLPAEAINANLGLTSVALVMAIGGVVNTRRVAETMSHKITRMSPGQGFSANLVTAILVTAASRLGLPVSTTHVSVGSLFGIGLVNRSARAKTVLAILLAWATTLPTAATLAAISYAVLN
jgi:PiT family inorganic phosphate transporter